MTNIARPKLLIEVKDMSEPTETAAAKGKKAVDPRIQKLNTILGPRGIRADEVLKKFDALTIDYQPGTPIPVYLSVLVDNKGKSLEYSMQLGMPSTAFIVKQKLGITKLAKSPNLKTPIQTVDKKFVDEIIERKLQFTTSKIEREAFFKSIVGSLRSFGIAYSG